MAELTDTHRRAALRSREHVARSRISSAVWGARVFAIALAALALMPVLVRRDDFALADTVLYGVLAALTVFASTRLARGSRAAAVGLLTLFILLKLVDWLLLDAPPYQGLIWTVILLGAFGNGVWGAYALAAVQRDAVHVPPAPPRGTVAAAAD